MPLTPDSSAICSNDLANKLDHLAPSDASVMSLEECANSKELTKAEQLDDLVDIIAQLLEGRAKENEECFAKQNMPIPYTSLFHTKTIAPFSIKDYLKRLVKWLKFEEGQLISALCIMDVYLTMNGKEHPLTRYNCYRLMAISFLLMDKIDRDDGDISLRTYGVFFGIDWKELKLLEVEFLAQINFSLFIFQKTYLETKKFIVEQSHLKRSEPEGKSSSSLFMTKDELNLLTQDIKNGNMYHPPSVKNEDVVIDPRLLADAPVGGWPAEKEHRRSFYNPGYLSSARAALASSSSAVKDENALCLQRIKDKKTMPLTTESTEFEELAVLEKLAVLEIVPESDVATELEEIFNLALAEKERLAQSERLADLVDVIAKLLGYTVRNNEQKLAKQNKSIPPTLFHSYSVPSISIKDYLSNIVQAFKFDEEKLITTFCLLNAYSTSNLSTGPLTGHNCHRLLAASSLIAYKLDANDQLLFDRYGPLLGLVPNELKQLKVEFLKKVNYSLAVSIKTILETKKYLIELSRTAEFKPAGKASSLVMTGEELERLAQETLNDSMKPSPVNNEIADESTNEIKPNKKQKCSHYDPRFLAPTSSSTRESEMPQQLGMAL